MSDETDVKPEPLETEPEAPRVLVIVECPVCKRNAVDGRCGFCGYAVS
jgi:hypothetical protein